MFSKDQINDLVHVLERRGVSLFHACQLQDLETYFLVPGIPSRGLLEDRQLSFTGFASDRMDKVNAVWDAVFFNLQDFGQAFDSPRGRARGWVPTIYGPITIVCSPSVLKPASDVAVCLRSAWTPGFDRSRESLQEVAEVDRLFKSPKGPEVKYRRQLEEDFALDEADNPEVSCTYDWRYVVWRFAKRIIVDPYEFQGRRLIEWVEEMPNRPRSVPLEERCDDPIYTEIGEALTLYPHTALSLASSTRVSENVRAWASSVADSDWPHQFDRFREYLWKGTISTILQRSRS